MEPKRIDKQEYKKTLRKLQVEPVTPQQHLVQSSTAISLNVCSVV